MTGTPLDLTPFGPLLSGLGLLYWLLAIAAVALALWYPKGWLFKLPLAALVLAVFVYPIVRHAQTRQVQHDESKARLDAAMALFAERCKTAGEKIHMGDINIKGIFLIRLRQPAEDAWFDHQFSQYDVFASEDGRSGQAGGPAMNAKRREPPPDSYILSFLKPTIVDPPVTDTIADHRAGRYEFVETVDPRDGKSYRYTARSIAPSKLLPEYGSWVRETDLVRVVIDKRTARYGVTWNDISEPADREHWITGSEVRIVDLELNELMAVRTGYVMDFAQGSTAGARSPWLFAKPCSNYQPTRRQTRFFVEKVLRPTERE